MGDIFWLDSNNKGQAKTEPAGLNAEYEKSHYGTLGWVGEDILIWTPDVIGSVCFLVASYLALIEVSHRFWSVQTRQVSWWIAVLNILGSVAFMLAALFTVFLPPSGEMEWAWGANFFTLLGAAGFFSASYLMIPELFGATGYNDK